MQEPFIRTLRGDPVSLLWDELNLDSPAIGYSIDNPGSLGSGSSGTAAAIVRYVKSESNPGSDASKIAGRMVSYAAGRGFLRFPTAGKWWLNLGNVKIPTYALTLGVSNLLRVLIVPHAPGEMPEDIYPLRGIGFQGLTQDYLIDFTVAATTYTIAANPFRRALQFYNFGATQNSVMYAEDRTPDQTAQAFNAILDPHGGIPIGPKQLITLSGDICPHGAVTLKCFAGDATQAVQIKEFV